MLSRARRVAIKERLVARKSPLSTFKEPGAKATPVVEKKVLRDIFATQA